MRGIVTGIGKEIEKMMKEKEMSIEELANKSNISVKLLKSFISLEKEPYVVPEIEAILDSLEISKDRGVLLLDKWVKMYRKGNR